MAELTKLTVNLIPPAVDALNRAAARLGEDRTETVNRALQMYDTLCTAKDGQSFAVRIRPDDERTMVVYDAVPSGRWRRLFTHGLPVALTFVAGLLAASAIWWAAS